MKNLSNRFMKYVFWSDRLEDRLDIKVFSRIEDKLVITLETVSSRGFSANIKEDLKDEST